MFLSCFLLDAKRPSIRQCLANAHDMHRSLMSGFPDLSCDCPRQDQGVLYRLMPSDHDIKLYLLSISSPDWSRLSDGFSLVDQPKDIDAVVESFRMNRRFAFDLLASPTKKKPRDGANSSRVFLYTEAERAAWLERKAAQNGFMISWVREEGQVKTMAAKNRNEQVIHFGVRFRGELCVVDDTQFKSAFCQGIGAGKSYGMGMLLLYPVGR